MSLRIGIVGLPNVGKSTLFNALTKKSVAAENFPFCTIDPSVGMVPVPDARLDALSRLSQSKQTIPATVEFVDIAGLVEGASKGEGLGNQFLSHIREVDAIAEVVRVFEDDNVVHVHGAVDPVRDINVINLELVLADLESVSKKKQRLEKEVRSGNKEAIALMGVVEKVLPALEAGKLANSVSLTEEERRMIRSLHLLTLKPFMYILNRKTDARNIVDMSDDTRAAQLKHFLDSGGLTYVEVDAGVEHELKDVAEDDALAFRREFGVLQSGVDALIRTGYTLLDLISFFTTGEKETRAWTIHAGSTAPDAGAAIHTDFRDKFIRAQVISAEKLIGVGSLAEARAQGLIRTEGKDYIVHDGDVIEFLHS